MSTAYVVVTIITILANAGSGVAALVRADFVRATADEVRVPQSWMTLFGTLQGAGAAGLLLGLMGIRIIGLAAATGLVIFFIGAITVHLRVRAFHDIALPGGYLALAVGSLALGMQH